MKNKSTVFILTAIVISSFCVNLSNDAKANLLVNGGFELPAITGPWVRFAHPSSQITGWSVTSGEVDISRGEWLPYEGAQSLDLVGLGVKGEISQVAPTKPGKVYMLTFQYANNPRPVPASAAVRVKDDAGNLIKELQVAHSGSKLDDMQWTQASVVFTATTSSTKVSFTALSEFQDGGLCIDSVTLNVNEQPPGSLVNGLQAYYPLMGHGGDTSGNNNRAENFGAVSTNNRFGDPNSALYFDGKSMLIAPSLIPSFQSGSTLTSWVNSVSKSSTEQAAVSKVGQVGARWGNLLRIGVFNGYGSTPSGVADAGFNNSDNNIVLTSKSTIQGSSWKHLAVTLDGATMTFYLNGLFVSKAAYSNNDRVSSNPLYIGNEGFQFRNGYFIGSISDVGVWNRALNRDEIARLYAFDSAKTSRIVSSVTVLPAERTVRSGSIATLTIMVSNNSTQAIPTEILFTSSNAAVPAPNSIVMTALGKKSATQPAKVSRRTLKVFIPRDVTGSAVITASVGGLSSSSALLIQPAKK